MKMQKSVVFFLKKIENNHYEDKKYCKVKKFFVIIQGNMEVLRLAFVI